MGDRERRCRQCTACKTAKCRKGAANACSACRNPAAKKGCLLRDSCLHYDQGATTDGNTSVGNTSGDEVSPKAQKHTSPNVDSCDSGLDEREQLSQFIEKTILKSPLEANLPSSPPRLFETTDIQDTVSRMESPDTVVKRPPKILLPADQSWDYDFDGEGVGELFASQRRQTNQDEPAMVASTPASTGQNVAFTPQFQPIMETNEDETLQELISTLNDFLIRVHPHHEAEITSVMNGINLMDHSDQNCLSGIFCQVIRRIQGYGIEIDVTHRAGMYLDLYKKSIDMLDANLDWDNPMVASPLARFGIEQEASRNDSNNLTVYIPSMGYEGIPPAPQERRPDRGIQSEQRTPERERQEELQELSSITSGTLDGELDLDKRETTERSSQENEVSPPSLETNTQQTSSLSGHENANPQNLDGNFFGGDLETSHWRKCGYVRALEEAEFEMTNIRGAYYGDATFEQARAMQERIQELHMKLTNVGLYFNQVEDILMMPRHQKLLSDLVVQRGFVEGRLRELSNITAQSNQPDHASLADPALGSPVRVDSEALRSIAQTTPGQASLLVTIATTTASITTPTTTTPMVTTTCGAFTSHSRAVTPSTIQNPRPDGRIQGLDEIVRKALQDIPEDIRSRGVNASAFNQSRALTDTPNTPLEALESFVLGRNTFTYDKEESLATQQRPLVSPLTPPLTNTSMHSQAIPGNAGTPKGILLRTGAPPGFTGPPNFKATLHTNGASNGNPTSARSVGITACHGGSHGSGGNDMTRRSGSGHERDNNSSGRASGNGNIGRGSQGNPNSNAGGPSDDEDSPRRPNGNRPPFRGPPPGGPPGSGFPHSGPPSPPREPPSSTNDRRRGYQSNRCFRNVIRLVKEGIDLHRRIRAELNECFRKSKEDDDLQTLSILNTVLPGIVEETGILRECTKHLTKELNYADFDTEFADDYITGFDNIIREVSQYKAKLTRLVSVNQLDRKTEANKILGEQKMEKFAGWDGGQIIHDYLKNLESYFHLGGVSKDKDMGVLLYSRMLSSHVKVQMNEHKDSYAAMKKALLRCYGEPKQILKIQLDKLGKIKFPIKDDMKSEIIYLRQFHSELKRIQDLVEELGQDTALGLEFYREGCFVDILTILGIGYRPVYKEWTRKEYTRLKIREDEKASMYHYSVYYDKFLKFIENFWKSIEIQINLRRGNQLFGKSKPKWSDPLGIKPDNEKQSKGEKPKNIGHLKTYLESQRSNLPVEAYSKMSKIIDGIHTSETSGVNPKLKTNKRNARPKDPAPDDFDKKCKLRCFVCPITANPHELASCKTGLRAGNKERHVKAVYLALCIACLRRDCRKKAEDTSTYWTCKNRHHWLACNECTNEAVKKGSNSWTTNILVCTRHTVDVDEDLLKKLVSRLGNNPKVDPVFITNRFSKSTGVNFTSDHSDEEIPRFQEIDNFLDSQGASASKGAGAMRTRLTETERNTIANSRSILKQSKDKEKKTAKSTLEHGKCKSYIEEKGVVYNSKSGDKIPITEDTRIKEESQEDTLYYFQMIRIGGYTILLFYDTGASLGIILGAIAEMLKLEILDTCQQAISGAANMLHRSPYGKYGMAIGPLSDGSFHKLSLTGLQQITHTVPLYDMTSLAEEARAYSNELGLKFAESTYPTKVGGNAAGMVLGMRTPHLLPKEQFILPSGLIVAQTEIMDVYGSRLVFGGTIAQITHANKIAGVHCTTIEGQTFYRTEYLMFKDSINGNNKFSQNWDDEVKSMPILIEDEVEGESCGLPDCYECNQKQSSRDEIDISLCFTGELRSKSRKEWEFQEFHTQNQDNTPHLNICSESCRRNEAICNFNEAFNLSKSNKRDTKSETVAGPVLYCQQTQFSTSKGVEKGSSGDEPNFDLASSSDESETEWDSFIGESGKDSEKPQREVQGGVCGPYNVSQHECLTCECVRSVVTVDDTYLGLDDLKKYAVFKATLKKIIREYEDLDEIGTVVDYRCPQCQNCTRCKESGKLRSRSVREEDEQFVIVNSIEVDYEVKRVTVKLPFLTDPAVLIKRWGSSDNYWQAKKVLQTQLKKTVVERQSMCTFWKEIKDKGFIIRLKDLPQDLQDKINKAPVKHYFPWRAVWNEHSITTPCRIVVDPRMSGLNEVLAKGENTLQSLLALNLNFRGWKQVGTFDISKMYNQLFLHQDHYQFQLILFVDEMNPQGEPEVWVLVRAMYGVTCTGNQAETAIRRAAKHFEAKYPLGAHAILTQTYVDDGLPTQDTKELLQETMEQIKVILALIGFLIKVSTLVFQKELSEKASQDGESIGVCGMRWFPKTDEYSLGKGEINFNPSIRGKKKPNSKSVETSQDVTDEIVPLKFTKAELVGKISEVYNLDGTVEPMKIHHKILMRIYGINQLDWKDYVPVEQREVWMEVFKNIQDVRLIKWRRAVVPVDAVDPTKMRLIETNDGSQYGSSCAVYAGFLLKDGSYSCHLLFARSTINDPSYSVPRNEQLGSVLGAQCLYILRHIFKNRIENMISVGDSRCNICWETNDKLRLKIWVFTRVRLVKRLAENVPRYWTKGENNPADFASKMGYTLKLLEEGSKWISGLPWMKMDVQQMIESKTIVHSSEIHSSLSSEDQDQIKTEELPTLGELFPLVQRNPNQKKVRFKVTTEVQVIPNREETFEQEKDTSQLTSCNIATASDSEDYSFCESDDETDKNSLGPARGIPNWVDSTAPRHFTKGLESEQVDSRENFYNQSVAAEKTRYNKSKGVIVSGIDEDNDLIYEVEGHPKGDSSQTVIEFLTSIDTQEAIRQARNDPKISEFRSEFIHYKCQDESVYPTSRGETSPGNPTSAGGSIIHTGSNPTSAGGSKMQSCLVATRADQNVREEVLKLPRARAQKKGKCKCKSCDQASIIDTVFYGLRKALLYMSIFAKWVSSCHHETHIGLKTRGENPMVQASLEAKCQVCKFRCKLCKYTIEKCDTCFQENLETKKAPVGEFKVAHDGVLDRIFKLNNVETDFFEEAEYRPEICLVNDSIHKVKIDSSKQDKSTKTSVEESEPIEGASLKGDDHIEQQEAAQSPEGNEVNTSTFPKLVIPEGYENKPMTTFLKNAIKNWGKPDAEDTKESNFCIFCKQVHVAKTTSTRKSVKGRFTEDVAKALDIQRRKDEAKKNRLAKVPILTDKIPDHLQVRISDYHRRRAWHHVMQVATKEAMKSMKNSEKSKYTYSEDLGILLYAGRLLKLETIEIRDTERNVFYDVPELNFVVPVVLPKSPIGYAIAMSVHWELLPHRGNHAQERALVQIVHIPGGRNLVQHIKSDCKRCRVLMVKTVKQQMGELTLYRVMIAPAFYAIQMDVVSPFVANCIHGKRSQIKILALVIVCISTGSIGIYALEQEDALSIVKAILRHSCRYGYPSLNFTDRGTGIIKAAKLKVQLRIAEQQLQSQIGMETHLKAVQSHGERGRVERAIRTVRSMLKRSGVHETKHSVMGWETHFAMVANMMNNVPIARTERSSKSNRGEADEILTPNRLLLGRNNVRSLERMDRSGTNLDSVLEKNIKIQNKFYELLIKNIFELVPQPKWFKNDVDLKVNDIVLYIHKESTHASEHYWRLGRVKEIKSDKKPTKVLIEYKNVNEKKFRTTERMTRELVVVHKVDDLDFNTAQHQQVLFASSHFSLRCSKEDLQREFTAMC